MNAPRLLKKNCAGTRNGKLTGAVLGLLIGDALGVPYEFTPQHLMPLRPFIEMSPPRGFPRAHLGVPPGTWSDDGAQLLVLLHALVHVPSLDLRRFANGLRNWRNVGFMTPDGQVFDVGVQTNQALARLEAGVSPELSGGSALKDNGNGSLMRCLPCAFFSDSPREVARLARLQSLPTHAHVRSQLSCALYALISHALLAGRGVEDAMTQACSDIRSFIVDSELPELELILAAESDVPTGSGYVVDSFWSAIHCVRTTNDYESCVKNAIALGNDTDTTACLAGGLAGLLYGVGAIPERWRAGLAGADVTSPLIESLLSLA